MGNSALGICLWNLDSWWSGSGIFLVESSHSTDPRLQKPSHNYTSEGRYYLILEGHLGKRTNEIEIPWNVFICKGWSPWKSLDNVPIGQIFSHPTVNTSMEPTTRFEPDHSSWIIWQRYMDLPRTKIIFIHGHLQAHGERQPRICFDEQILENSK